MSEPTCAVWHWRYHSLYVELFEDEEDAAGFAYYLQEDDHGSVQGVQFSDGRYVDRDDWDAFARRGKRAETEPVTDRADEPNSVRVKVAAPFDDDGRIHHVTMDADEVPSWLGRHVREATSYLTALQDQFASRSGEHAPTPTTRDVSQPPGHEADGVGAPQPREGERGLR